MKTWPSVLIGSGRSRRRLGHDVYAPPVFIEFHPPVNQRVERPIAADADIYPGIELGAALADDDAACCDELAAESFDTQPLAVAVAPVS